MALPYLEEPSLAASPRTLPIAGLVVAGILAVVAAAAAATMGSESSAPDSPAPGRVVSVEQVFSPIAGYTFEGALPSGDAALRAQLESTPGAMAITADVGGRRVLQKGKTIAVASAAVFQEQAAASAGAAFLAAAPAGITAPEQVILAGHPAVFGQESDGIKVFFVYKNRVGLVVGGPADRATLEKLTTKLLANVP